MSTNIRPLMGSACRDDGNVTANCSADPAGGCRRQPRVTATNATATRWYGVMGGERTTSLPSRTVVEGRVSRYLSVYDKTEHRIRAWPVGRRFVLQQSHSRTAGGGARSHLRAE